MSSTDNNHGVKAPDTTEIVNLIPASDGADAVGDTTPIEQPQSKKRESRFYEFLHNWWTVEVFSLALSVAAAGVIAGVLKCQDNRPLSDWNHDITINTVVSFLALISRSTLAVVISVISISFTPAQYASSSVSSAYYD
jgi:ABC-type transporter Mla maintaining outer membrane lipid asymmetry permease subunit MlaE